MRSRNNKFRKQSIAPLEQNEKLSSCDGKSYKVVKEPFSIFNTFDVAPPKTQKQNQFEISKSMKQLVSFIVVYISLVKTCFPI
jgi:hypothetical protein